MFDTDPHFDYNKFSNAHGDFGPGKAYVFDTSEYGEGQHLLVPAFQIGPRYGSYPDAAGTDISYQDFLKRYTLQVGPLQYPGETSAKYTEYSSLNLLMDFNTEDLYTKSREAGQWEGNYPQYDRSYGNNGGWG